MSLGLNRGRNSHVLKAPLTTALKHYQKVINTLLSTGLYVSTSTLENGDTLVANDISMMHSHTYWL